MPTTKVALSLIVPTRERAHYLPHALRTCLADPLENIEVLVLDNASTDNTQALVASVTDPRLRYIRSDNRLSMRQNFEKGLQEASGEILCFIGDDDGVLPGALRRAISLMQDPDIAAVSNERAHYGWPDLNPVRRNLALIPRGSACRRMNSLDQLREMPRTVGYYGLPCLYHGFVRRSLVEKVRKRDGLFFNSSQVDIYSAIALSMENVDYLYSEEPLIINGGSRRSNGASYQGQTEGEEKGRWVQEDDLSFLPGYDNPISVGCAVIESGLRYAAVRGLSLEDIFSHGAVVAALAVEWEARNKALRLAEETATMLDAAAVTRKEVASSTTRGGRLQHLAGAFLKMRPVDTAAEGIVDVHAASEMIGLVIAAGGTSLWSQPFRQIGAALRFAR